MIRPCRVEDYDTMEPSILDSIMRSPAGALGYDPDTVRGLFSGQCLALALEESGEVAGIICCWVGPSTFNHAATVGLVFLWVVRKEFQGRGVGRALLEEVESRCADNGARAVVIMAGPGAPTHVSEAAGFSTYKNGLIKEL